MAKLTAKGGTALTAEVVEPLADEAEAGYDLSKAKRRRRGRPSLGTAGTSERVQIRLDPALAHALHERAAQENTTVSEIGRAALRAYVDGVKS